jgi:hypothetical protein
MQPNKALFFVIVGLSLMAVVAMFFVRLMIPGVSPETVSIQIVVAPAIRPWVEAAAGAFNAQNPNRQVRIIEADRLIPEAQLNSPQPDRPVAWLADSSFIVAWAQVEGLALAEARSVASTPLAWGTFKSKEAEFSGGLTWEAIHERAIAPNSALKIVIASPRSSAEGLAVLISATAAQARAQSLTASEVNNARSWLNETFKESTRNSLTLSTPAEDFVTRGLSIGDAGMLSMRSWRKAGVPNRADFSLMPPQSSVVLDYPLVIQAGFEATNAEQTALAFRDFLLSPSQQNTLTQFFFDPALTTPATGVQADGQAVQSLSRWAELELK